LDNNICLPLVNNLCLPLDHNLCLLLDNNIGLRSDHVFCWTLAPVDIFYLIQILGSSTFSFHLVNTMLITCESSIGVFSAFNLIIALSLILYPSFHYFLHLLSTNHKCTQPCYFLLLYIPAAQKLKEILDSLMRSSRRAITPDRLPMVLWCLSATMLL
jgi:hypothetical protein